MVDQHPKAVPDADAALIAALLRLTVNEHGMAAVQDELVKIKIDITGERNYWDPFGARISEIKQLAGLE